jgi:hypothetical protein
MKSATFLLLVLLFISLPSCKFLREKGLIGKRSNSAAILKAKQDSTRVADSIKNAQQLLALEAEKLEAAKKAEQAKLDYEAKFKYKIIVGSFITPKYAKDFQAEFVKKGYDAKILKLEGTQFEMVSVEAHDSFRKAFERVKLFQDSVSSDSWIYVATRK